MKKAIPPRAGPGLLSSRKGDHIVFERGHQAVAAAVTFPFRVRPSATTSNPLKITVDYGPVIDQTDWQAPLVIIPKIGEASIDVATLAERPKLSLPDADQVLILLKIKQGTAGAISEDSDAVTIVALEEMPASVPTNLLYILIATITTDVVAGKRRFLKIRQSLASAVIWPYKPDFMGWQQADPEDEDSRSALWLGDQSPWSAGADQLNDLWIQVRRTDFDNGLEGDSVFFLGMDEDAASYQLGFHRSDARGISLIMNDETTSFSIDQKTEVDPGIKFNSSDHAWLNVVGPGETSNILTTADDDSAKIHGSGGDGVFLLQALGDDSTSLELTGYNGGTAVLSANESGQLSLDDTAVTLSAEGGLDFDEGATIYQDGSIVIGETTYEPHTLTSGESTFKILADDDIDIVGLPCCMDWDDDTDTLLIGDGTDCSIVTFKLLADNGETSGKIAFNNATQPYFLMEYNGGKLKIDVNEFAGIDLNDGQVSMGTEAGFLMVNEDDETEGNLTDKSLTLGDQSGDGVDINSEDIPTGKGIVKIRELDVCHMGAAGKRPFVCGESYAAS